MSEFICLDDQYSTTRMLTKKLPDANDDEDDQAKILLLYPAGKVRQGEGGLRLKGYFKSRAHNKPLITVVTVVYNGANFLEDTIESIINQTYSNVEFIIIDGGSKDGTLDIILKYEHVVDYYVSETDGGIYNAMNKALKLAFGDWVIFLGADDLLTNCLTKVASQMQCPDNVYYGNVQLFSSGNLYDGPFNRYKLMQQNICHQSIFYPYSVYKVKNYDERCRFLADYKYNMELFGSGTPFAFISETVAIFNDKGVSSVGDEYFQKIKISLIRSELGILFWMIKKIRNSLVFLLKGRL